MFIILIFDVIFDDLELLCECIFCFIGFLVENVKSRYVLYVYFEIKFFIFNIKL